MEGDCEYRHHAERRTAHGCGEPAPRTAPDLALSVHRLHGHLSQHLPYPFRITISDNASTDATLRIAAELATELTCVTAMTTAQKGRGRALQAAWSGSDAQVLAYCDVDLSTDLAAMLPLVAPLISGHSDLAIGTRLGRGSRVVRGAKRELISRGYNILLHAALAVRFSDARCGFKAIRAGVAHRLLPLVEGTGWFFDTELLVLAEAQRPAYPRGAHRSPGYCPPHSNGHRTSCHGCAGW